MAINPHHTVEELNGIRCSIVERKVSPERAEFLKAILEHNHFEVISSSDAEGKVTIGTTDLLFNPVHAIYGHYLKAPNGQIVTPSYWYKQEFNKGFYWEY